METNGNIKKPYEEAGKMQKSAQEIVELKNLNENSERPELKRLLTTDLEQKYRDTPLTEDTTCGYGFIQNEFLQK